MFVWQLERWYDKNTDIIISTPEETKDCNDYFYQCANARTSHYLVSDSNIVSCVVAMHRDE